MIGWASIAASVLSALGCAYLVVAAIMATRFARRPSASVPRSLPGVTMLKPLHGEEAALFDNLASFCAQDYRGPLQIVFGVQDQIDPAIAVVARLRAAYPDREIALVVDATSHGTNRKVSNLINMAARIRHEVVVLADSDIRVAPDHLDRIVAALAEPGIGAVTCLYHGIATEGFWPRLFALAVDAHFLPNVLTGLELHATQPCFGSTIALRRDTLTKIGGFEAIKDYLADDYALGEAVRSEGYRIAIPPFVIAHVTGPMSGGEVWRHELRWARIVRSLAPGGYAGLVVTHPLPWSLIAGVTGGIWIGMAGLGGPSVLALLAVLARIALVHRISHLFGLPRQSYWLLPLGDLLSFAVFVASFFGRGVDWRGSRYRIRADGTGRLREP